MQRRPKTASALQRDNAAIKIQAAVRGHLTRSSFRKATELGRRQAARAALNARRSGAAVTIQKHVRRRSASKRVSHAYHMPVMEAPWQARRSEKHP